MQQRKAKVSKPYDYSRSWNYAIWLLSRQAYTKKQIRDKLKKKEASPEDIDKVIAELERLKFVDDALYAESYVRTRRAGKGSIALKQELRLKGIAEDILEATLEPLDIDSQAESALLALEKMQWRYLKVEQAKRYGKAYAFLARRGFPSDAVKLALEKVSFLQEE